MEMATKLRIKITENEKDKVNLTFPIYTLRHIESLMPNNVINKLEQKNIHLKEILASINKEAPAVQEIFKLSEGVKTYNVWVE